MAKIILNVDMNTSAALAQMPALKAACDELASSFAKAKNNSGLDDLQKQYANLFNTIKNSASSYSPGLYSQVAKEVRENLDAVKGLNEQLKSNGSLTKEERKEANRLQKELKALSARFATVRAESEKITKSNKLAVPSIDNLRKGYANLASAVESASKYYAPGTFDEITKAIGEQQAALASINPSADDYAEKVKNIDKTLNKLQADFAETKAKATNFHGTLIDLVSGFFKFQVAAMLVMQPLQKLKQAFASVNEELVSMEDNVISIKRVVGDDISDEAIYSGIYKIAEKYGQDVENIASIATNFARTGMSWNDTLKATEAAALALNVAELEVTDASDGMIAILSQFEIKASDLTDVVDKLNKTADKFPVTSEKILVALQRTGSAAKNANLTLDETVGLITGLSKATGRSGENIGTALNSLIAYSSKDAALDTFAALSSNMEKVVGEYRKGAASILDVWTGLSEEINHLTEKQADLLDDYFATEDGSELKSALDSELGDIYDSLNGVYSTANTFRKNYFIALLANMDTVQDAIDTAAESAGYSQKENEEAMKTYTKLANANKAKWKEIANDEQGLLGIKKNLAGINSFILDVIKGTGGLKTTFIAAGSAAMALFGPKILSGISTLSIGLGKAVKNNLNLVAAMKAYRSAAYKADALNKGYTIGTISKAKADEAAAAAAKAHAAAMSTLFSYIGIAITIISAISGAIDQHREKMVQYTSDVLEKTQENAEAMLELQSKLNDGKTSYDDLTTAFYKQAKAMGYTEDAIDDLILKYNGLEGAINAVTKEQLESQVRDARSNLNYVSKKSFGDLSKLGIFNAQFSGGWQGSQYEIEKYSPGFLSAFKEAHLSNDMSAIYEYYIALEKARDALSSNKEAPESLLLAVENKIASIYSPIQEYIAAVTALEEAQKALDEFTEKRKEDEDQTENSLEEQNKTLSQIKGKYSDIVASIKEAKDLRDEETSLMEKQLAVAEAKLAVEEAEQALYNAQNERTVRVFNQKTGEWEWQASGASIRDAQKDLDSAQKNYEDAKNNLADYLDQKAFDEILSIFQSGNSITEEQVQAIIDKWESEGISDENLAKWEELFEAGADAATESLLDLIHRVLKDEYGIDIPESSAAQSGLLFGGHPTGFDASPAPSNPRLGPNVTNQNYYISGVPITTEMAHGYSFSELAANMVLTLN